MPPDLPGTRGTASSDVAGRQSKNFNDDFQLPLQSFRPVPETGNSNFETGFNNFDPNFNNFDSVQNPDFNNYDYDVSAKDKNNNNKGIKNNNGNNNNLGNNNNSNAGKNNNNDFNVNNSNKGMNNGKINSNNNGNNLENVNNDFEDVYEDDIEYYEDGEGVTNPQLFQVIPSSFLIAKFPFPLIHTLLLYTLKNPGCIKKLILQPLFELRHFCKGKVGCEQDPSVLLLGWIRSSASVIKLFL